jgi:hypothetical protein
MENDIVVNPKLAVERLEKAFNARDVDALAECFDPLYMGEEPLHAESAFRGRERIRTTWNTTFQRLPDFTAKILRSIADQDTCWVEWKWTGTQADKKRVEMRGVTILGVRNGRFIWGRLFMEPVQAPGQGLESVVR